MQIHVNAGKYLLLFAVKVLHHFVERSNQAVIKFSIVFLWSDGGRRAMVDWILTKLPPLKTSIQHGYITMTKYLKQW